MTRATIASGGASLVLPTYLGLCLIMGGASAAGVLANAFLQLVAVAILATLAWQHRRGATRREGQERFLLLLVALAVLFPLAQMIPLPSVLWQHLPGRGSVAAQDDLLGLGAIWRPISLQPNRTLIALLGLLPPIATLALTLRAGAVERRAAIAVLLLVGVISSTVGLLQVLQGGDGSAYFYSTTNTNTSVGFFANSNHLATLFLLAAVFSTGFPYSPRAHGAMWRTIRVALVVFFLLNLAVNRSLAGYLLALPVALFALAVSGPGRAARRRLPWLVPIGVLVAAILLVALTVAGAPLLGSIALNTTDPSRRLLFLHNTLTLIRQSFPFGYGFSTFRWSYAGVEDIGAVTLVYVNHAHNDVAELISDLGLGGVLLMAGLIAWFAMRVWQIARTAHPLPAYVAPAMMGVALVSLHSLVDYPIRTAAIAATFAMCLGLAARPFAADGGD